MLEYASLFQGYNGVNIDLRYFKYAFRVFSCISFDVSNQDNVFDDVSEFAMLTCKAQFGRVGMSRYTKSILEG